MPVSCSGSRAGDQYATDRDTASEGAVDAISGTPWWRKLPVPGLECLDLS